MESFSVQLQDKLFNRYFSSILPTFTTFSRPLESQKYPPVEASSDKNQNKDKQMWILDQRNLYYPEENIKIKTK